MTFLGWAMLSVAVYRCTRFVILDTAFEDTRDRLNLWLAGRRKRLLFRKLADGLFCAFCISVWFAAAAVWFWSFATPYDLGWVSIIDVLAVAGGAMVVYRWVDPPE